MLAPSLRLWRSAFIACAVAVLVLALLPIDQPLPSTGWDKTDHVLAFSVLGLLGIRSSFGRPTHMATALLAYGIAIELLQALTPYRFGEWRDVVADAVGIGGAMLVVRITGFGRPDLASA